MAMTGLFGGFYFDPEEFSRYMTENPTWNDRILASGVLVQDNTIMDLIGEKGNVATLPFYKPIDEQDSQALNNDGLTDNTPTEITGSKQTCMLIQRMKAWQSQDFTKELTGADPMTHVANSVAGFYKQTRTRDLMSTVEGVLSLSGMENHITDLSASGDSATDANKIDDTTLIFAQQKALGDSDDKLGLLVMHSYIYAKYKAMGLVDYNKYTIANAVEKEVTLPKIGGFIPIVTDRFTVDTTKPTLPVYKTFMIGSGSILTCDKTNYENPYYTDYDPEKKAGIQKLYTKQGYVLHPNGFSIKADKIAKESPTVAELGDKAKWSLAFNEKNIRMGMIKSNG